MIITGKQYIEDNYEQVVNIVKSAINHFKFNTDVIISKDDFVSEVMIKLMKVKNVTKIKPLLYTISRNLYVSMLRAHKYKSELKHDIGFVSDSNHKEILRICKDNLSERNFSIFDMYQQGYKYKEISEKMGIKQMTILNLIHRIRHKLRDVVEK